VQEGPAAQLLATRGHVADQSSLISGPDLGHFDPSSKTAGEHADEFAKVDPSGGGEVKDQFLAVEKILRRSDLHGQPKLRGLLPRKADLLHGSTNFDFPERHLLLVGRQAQHRSLRTGTGTTGSAAAADPTLGRLAHRPRQGCAKFDTAGGLDDTGVAGTDFLRRIDLEQATLTHLAKANGGLPGHGGSP
jgi:hypothetical protein